MLGPSPWYGSGIAIWSNSREPLATKQIGNSCMSCCERRHQNKITIHKQKQVTQFLGHELPFKQHPPTKVCEMSFLIFPFREVLLCWDVSKICHLVWSRWPLHLPDRVQVNLANRTSDLFKTYTYGEFTKGSKPDLNGFKAILDGFSH